MRLLAGLCSIGFASSSASSASNLWAALQHATGFTDDELSYLAEELGQLPAPSQKSLWQEKVHCSLGRCAPEATSRLVAALGEVGLLPSRVFELFPGDPLYPYWKESDKTPFHSWVNGQGSDEESLEALIPEGQPLAAGRIQASSFTWKAKALIQKLLGPFEIDKALGRCLEWDTPFYVIKAFHKLCFRTDILQYANPKAGIEEKMQVYRKGTRPGRVRDAEGHKPMTTRAQSVRVLQLDVLDPPEWMPNDYGLDHVSDDSFDVLPSHR